MQQIITKFKPVAAMCLIMLATAFFVSCNNEPAKTEEPKKEAAPADKTEVKPAATDTLPPVDSQAKSRPEPRKTISPAAK